jgi:flavodoxin
MKILVTFYSKNGHTKVIGNKIARQLNADIEEITDLKDRSKIFTWAKSAFDEELRTATTIKKPEKDPAKYDIVIIGTPIWDGITPAVKKYLQENKNKLKKIAFFSTFGASAEDAFYQMEKISGKKPIATLEIQDVQIMRKEDAPLIEEFCRKIK